MKKTSQKSDRARHSKKVCGVCKTLYNPTSQTQKRCSKCAPDFNKKQDAEHKARRQKMRPWCRLVEAAKTAAKVKGLAFNLTSDYVRSIWNDTCPILGVRLVRNGSVRTDRSPSLDRVVPEVGYVVDNVQVISWRANRIKNDATVEELVKIAKYFRKLGLR